MGEYAASEAVRLFDNPLQTSHATRENQVCCTADICMLTNIYLNKMSCDAARYVTTGSTLSNLVIRRRGMTHPGQQA